MREIILIAAMDKNRVIGKNNTLPWNLPGDRKRFALVTEGGTVVMGRITYESIVTMLGKPLPGRRSIVFTRQAEYPIPAEFRDTVSTVSSWDEMLHRAGGAEEIFIVGGEEIYRLALPHADRVILTRVDAECEGDTFFPELSEKEWRRIYSDNEGFHKERPEDEYPYMIDWYTRRPRPPAVAIDNARLPEQREAMERILARGHCPFCPENLTLEHKKPILHTGDFWVVTENQWPYKNTKLHLILILRHHATTIADIPIPAFAELGEHLRWIENEYGVSGGAFCARFGDTNSSKATVSHVHVQFIVPNRNASDFESVIFYIGKK